MRGLVAAVAVVVAGALAPVNVGVAPASAQTRPDLLVSSHGDGEDWPSAS